MMINGKDNDTDNSQTPASEPDVPVPAGPIDSGDQDISTHSVRITESEDNE